MESRPVAAGNHRTNAAPAPTATATINEIPVAQLEHDMRPGRLSVAGFLGPTEALLDVLAADDSAVRALGTSHQAIGAALRELMRLAESASPGERLTVTAGGERFAILVTQFNGSQASPFKDGTRASSDVAITRLATGMSVSFSELLPTMIERYGFYEGHGTPYRVAPSELVALVGPLLSLPSGPSEVGAAALTNVTSGPSATHQATVATPAVRASEVTLRGPAALAEAVQTSPDWNEQLAAAGFTRIGDTPFWERGVAVACVRQDGTPVFFHAPTSKQTELDPLRLQAIERADGGVRVWAETDKYGATYVEASDNGSSMMIRAKSPPPAGRGSLGEQLVRAGFTDVFGDGSLLRGRLPGHEEASATRCLLMRDGKVERVLEPIHPSSAARITRETRLLAYCARTGPELGLPNEFFDRLVLQNELMRFELCVLGATRNEQLLPAYGGERDWATVRLGALGVPGLEPHAEPGSDFVVGAMNSPAVIARTRTLSGQPIERLEARMRPCASSTAGFLGNDERLLAVLAEDAELVRAAGRTHEELGTALARVAALASLLGNEENRAEFTAGGERFVVTRQDWLGMQHSPFRDGTSALSDFAVTRCATGDTLTFSALIPAMVLRYGFYEGHGTRYRVEPAAIMRVLAPFLA